MTTLPDETKALEALKAEPCAHCGSPLAADQRYCLHCGERRAQARLDFIDILSEDALSRGTSTAAAPAVAAVPARTGAEGWIRSNAGILALAALLLLTLVGGLAIGSWINGGDSSGSSSKPQVITVQGGGSSSGDSSSGGSSDTGSSGGGSSDDGGASSSSGAAKGGTGSTKGVKSADGKSSKDIEKSVDKGEPLSTGTGAAPKADDKAAGGGSDFETIQ